MERFRVDLEEEKQTREHQSEEIIIDKRELTEARIKLADMEKLVEELRREVCPSTSFYKSQKIKTVNRMPKNRR